MSISCAGKTSSFTPSAHWRFPCSQAVINTMCGFGVQAQSSLEADKSIYPVGCADRAVVWIESHLLLVGALTLGLALPQVNPTSQLGNPKARLHGYAR